MEDSTILMDLTVASQACLQGTPNGPWEGQVDSEQSTEVTISQQVCWSFVSSNLSTTSSKISYESDRLVTSSVIQSQLVRYSTCT